jgi:hypothetical protein
MAIWIKRRIRCSNCKCISHLEGTRASRCPPGASCQPRQQPDSTPFDVSGTSRHLPSTLIRVLGIAHDHRATCRHVADNESELGAEVYRELAVDSTADGCAAAAAGSCKTCRTATNGIGQALNFLSNTRGLFSNVGKLFRGGSLSPSLDSFGVRLFPSVFSSSQAAAAEQVLWLAIGGRRGR